MSRTHLHTRAQNAHTLSQCTSSQKEHQSIALSCTSFCYRVQPLSHTKRIRWGNYNTLILRRLFSKHQPPLKCHSFFSFFFYLRIKRFCKIARFILGWHDGGKTNNYPRGISHPWVNLWERGEKGAQPLWVKGFRSRFNWLPDIRTVKQKSWSGIWTRIHLLNDWHLRDRLQKNEGRVLC